MFGYHIFKFSIYDLAENYSLFLSKMFNGLKNSKDEDKASEIFQTLASFVESCPIKNRYNKSKLKNAFLSYFEKKDDNDINMIFEHVAEACCDFKRYNPGFLGEKIGEINGFKW